MRNNKTSNQHITIFPPNPLPRILTTTDHKKWKGCIYFSAYDLTGQVLMFLREVSAEYSGSFLKNPVYVYTAASKAELETKIFEKVRSLFKKQ